MLAVKLNELDGYRGKQISMIPQNPMTAFAPMLKLGKQMELGFPLKGRRERTQFRGGWLPRLRMSICLMRKKSSTAIPMSCPVARCSA